MRSYSRSEYVHGSKSKHRLKRWQKVLIGVGCVLAAIIIAGSGYVLWYMHQIDSNMQITTDTDLLDALSSDNGSVAYTLVLGSDNRTGTYQQDQPKYQADAGGRSDVIMLVRTDTASKTVTLVSIPRDTLVDLNGTPTKINEAMHQGGSAYAVKTIEDLCGIKISHFAEMDFQDLENFIDILGGVTVDVPVGFSDKDIITGDTISVDAGTQTLDGQHALLFARQRDAYGDNQETKRQSNVRLLVAAVVKNITDRSITEIPGLILDLSSCVSTDMSASEMVNMATSFSGGGITIYSCTGPYSGGTDDSTGLWVVNADAADWAKLMAVVDAGGDPSTVTFSDSGTAAGETASSTASTSTSAAATSAAASAATTDAAATAQTDESSYADDSYSDAATDNGDSAVSDSTAADAAASTDSDTAAATDTAGGTDGSTTTSTGTTTTTGGDDDPGVDV